LIPFKPSENESMAYTSSPLVRPGAPPLSEDTSKTILLSTNHGSCKSITKAVEIKNVEEER